MRNRPQTRESEPVLAPLSGDIRLCRLYGANSAGRFRGYASYCWRPYTVT